MEHEADRQIGASATVMRSMYGSVVVKEELSHNGEALDLLVNLRSYPRLW